MFQSRKILRNQAQLIQEIRQTNQLLQAIPDQISKKSGTLAIENLNIKQASLDKLLFQLEKIDVKELSGTLNLGNNFYTPENEEDRPSDSSSPELRKLIQSTDMPSNVQHQTSPSIDKEAQPIMPESDRLSLDDVQPTVYGYTVKVSQS